MEKLKRFRSPNKIKPTEDTHGVWKWFLKPFAEAYSYAAGQTEQEEGYNAFFNVTSRRLIYCKAKSAFKMPGSMWVSTSGPKLFIDGTGRRHVKAGDSFVIRVDSFYPDRVEIEFDEQVFVVPGHQYDAISENVKLEA